MRSAARESCPLTRAAVLPPGRAWRCLRRSCRNGARGWIRSHPPARGAPQGPPGRSGAEELSNPSGRPPHPREGQHTACRETKPVPSVHSSSQPSLRDPASPPPLPPRRGRLVLGAETHGARTNARKPARLRASPRSGPAAPARAGGADRQGRLKRPHDGGSHRDPPLPPVSQKAINLSREDSARAPAAAPPRAATPHRTVPRRRAGRAGLRATAPCGGAEPGQPPAAPAETKAR